MITAEALVNTGSLLLIAVINLTIAVLTWRTHQITSNTDRNMTKVELATNSMKDALVAATAKASFSEGADAERLKQKLNPLP